MSRYNDNSWDCRRWTNAKLLARIKETASLATFTGNIPQGYVAKGFPADDGDMLRETTRCYRQAWLEPALEELAKRLKVTL